MGPGNMGGLMIIGEHLRLVEPLPWPIEGLEFGRSKPSHCETFRKAISCWDLDRVVIRMIYYLECWRVFEVFKRAMIRLAFDTKRGRTNGPLLIANQGYLRSFKIAVTMLSAAAR